MPTLSASKPISAAATLALLRWLIYAKSQGGVARAVVLSRNLTTSSSLSAIQVNQVPEACELVCVPRSLRTDLKRTLGAQAGVQFEEEKWHEYLSLK